MFSFNDPPTTEIYTLSLHDALPILAEKGLSVRLWCRDRERAEAMRAERENRRYLPGVRLPDALVPEAGTARSEEHTSELQSHHDLVCRLLLEKKNTKKVRQSPPVSK